MGCNEINRRDMWTDGRGNRWVPGLEIAWTALTFLQRAEIWRAAFVDHWFDIGWSLKLADGTLLYCISKDYEKRVIRVGRLESVVQGEQDGD